MRHPDRGRVPCGVALAVGAVLGLAVGCGEEENPNVDTYELSGYVRDTLDNRAISGATVTFRSDTLRMADARTDGEGLYEMVVETDVAFGQVRAEAAGFQGAEASVFFDTPRRRVDIRLRPEGAPEE
jgi:hypothetical protein